MNKPYEIVSHTADLEIHFFGDTKEKLFEHAFVGMFDAIKPRYSSDHLQEFHISLTANDLELLLVDALSEALYLSDAYGVAFKKAKINTLSDTHITATLSGSEITSFDVVEIKAVTYHNLSITHSNNLWKATVVFDI